MDDRSRRNLESLHPDVQSRFEAFLTEAQTVAKSKGLEYKAISGTRSWEEQAKIYALGRTTPGRIVTKAPPGHSMHNFGLAIDCGVFRNSGYLDENEPKTASAMHKEAGKIAEKHGRRWGGNFKSIVDEPHFELDTPLRLSQLRDRKKSGEWVSLAV